MPDAPSRGSIRLLWFLIALVLAVGAWRLATLHHSRSADQQILLDKSGSK